MANKAKKYFSEFVDSYMSEFKLIRHDGGIILFFLFLPLVYPVIYSLIYNPEVVRDVRMVVVDHDRSAESRDFVRRLDATQETYITGYAADLNEARHAMNSHKCYGILEIEESFGRRLSRGEQANAVLYCDMSLLLRYRGFLVAATSVSQEMGAEMLARKIDNIAPAGSSYTAAVGDPMPIENIALGNSESGFDSFIMPGVVVLILHQCIILAAGMAGGNRRETVIKLGYNPWRRKNILVAMSAETLAYITILIVPVIFLLYFIPVIFSFPMQGDFVQILAFIFPMVLACIGLGFCFQGIVWEREAVFVLWVATSLAFLFLSGITWPRYAMPPVWKGLGDILPGVWGVEGFIKMNTNGASLAQVSYEYRWLWILAAFYMAAGYCVRRWVFRPSLNRELRLRGKQPDGSPLATTP